MWSQGASTGGTPVLDYSVYSDKGASTYELVQSGINDVYYTTNFLLIAGTVYKFKVIARNSIGQSSFSSVLPVIAARAPDAPINIVVLSTSATTISIKW